jgi:hypothetical protein
MADPEPENRWFYISEPKVVALFAVAIAFLVYCPFAAYGHDRLGKVVGGLVFGVLAVGYLLRDKLKGRLRGPSRD